MKVLRRGSLESLWFLVFGLWFMDRLQQQAKLEIIMIFSMNNEL